MDEVKTFDEILNIVAELRKKGKKIVTTNGCFDILHVGHVKYLKEAKKLGDVLIVAVNSDRSVRKIKGPGRPITNEKDRMEILSSLSCVDYVFPFDEPDPVAWISKLKPDIHVKGGDYTMDRIIEKDAVESYGGKIVLLKKIDAPSTTDLIKKIRGE
jgi:rfaE bifunctional protein nucleotidyltransferase chain/domain